MSFLHRIAGDIALDLANMVSWRGRDRKIDHLASAEDIVAWAKEGGLVAGSYAIDASECDMLINRTRRCAQR